MKLVDQDMGFRVLCRFIFTFFYIRNDRISCFLTLRFNYLRVIINFIITFGFLLKIVG
ncbi:Uncharacterised protein [Enterobacter hormaechei]|nr:Uncharacterised protein [Enterobacter hormaechei]